MEELLKKLTTEELELFFIQAWLIYNQRNTITHGWSLQDPSQLNKRVTDFLNEFREAQQHLTVQTSAVREVHWSPPPRNSFKLYFDASIFEDLNASGFSAVIRNKEGEVMAAMAARGYSVSMHKSTSCVSRVGYPYSQWCGSLFGKVC